MDFQAEKELVLSFYKALENAALSESSAVFENYCSTDWLWRGVHPFDVQTGPVAVDAIFWSGFSHAFSSLQRRMDMFMAGENSLSETKETWVTSMGHFMGLFDNPWLGIKPTHKLVLLRYAEFHRIKAGKIVETALFLDIPALMMQVGLRPFPDQTAAQVVHPGPLPHDAIMTASQPASEGAKTLAAINQMISDLGQWKSGLPLEEELARSWHKDMVWWGPAGIGATRLNVMPNSIPGHFVLPFLNAAVQGTCVALPRGTTAAFSVGQISRPSQLVGFLECLRQTRPENLGWLIFIADGMTS